MKILPDMHRVGKQPQWADVAQKDLNSYQKRAIATHGIDTPGNRETAMGCIESLLGNYAVKRQQPLLGFVLLLHGGLRDLRDGKIAAATETKSPLGEAFDASADNALQLTSAIVFRSEGLISSAETVTTAAMLALRGTASALAKYRGFEHHSSRVGKLGMMMTRLRYGGKALTDGLRQIDMERAANITEKATTGFQVASLSLNAVATIGYVAAALNSAHQEKSMYGSLDSPVTDPVDE